MNMTNGAAGFNLNSKRGIPLGQYNNEMADVRTISSTKGNNGKSKTRPTYTYINKFIFLQETIYKSKILQLLASQTLMEEAVA